MKSDPLVKARRRRSEFWQLSCLISLSSLLVSMYAVFLSQRLAPASSQHELDEAALALARDLGNLTVSHHRFGKVALLDLSDGKNSQMGLNRLQATLRLDGMIAKQLGFEKILKLVRKDAIEVAQLNRELLRLQKELSSANAPRHFQGRDSFLELVRRKLAVSGANSRLKSLRIILGGVNLPEQASGIALPRMAGEESASYAAGRIYKTHVKVPILDEIGYKFYDQADSTKLVPPALFHAVAGDDLASAVLIEADFDVAERGRSRHIQHMKSCAVVGAEPPQKLGSVFMLSFPHGYYSAFACLSDIFDANKYRSRNAKWLQASGGNIPGPGYLISANSPMPTAEALNNAFYHFLFSCGPELLPENLELLLKQAFSTIKVGSESNAIAADSFNSALFRDTGAADFALSRQSGPSGKGQEALSAAFSAKELSKFLPAYAFPLAVDKDGHLNMPQERGLDKDLLRDFLQALYQTNIAGIESMHLGEMIANRMRISEEKSAGKIASFQEELLSVERSIDSLSSPNDAINDEKLRQLNEQAASLGRSISEEETKRQHYQKIEERAKKATANAREAARTSFEIASHMSSFVGKGLKRVSAPVNAFLLSRKVLFIPKLTALTEDEIYESRKAPDGDSSEKNENDNFWTSRLFRVTDIPEADLLVDKKPLVEYWQSKPLQIQNPPLYILLCSGELTGRKTNPRLFASRQTPFDNASLENCQLCYFAPQAVSAAPAAETSWSVLIRDLVYNLFDGNGQLLPSSKARWCLDLGMDEENCPGLAVEMQIRTPV
ncbi:MAG: hypothetical protein K2X27_08460, partial [Candidatus Obscuribacterales bacterium]|nr:hypothetical protein [Candidatus Obscuribacterales bacterium]